VAKLPILMYHKVASHKSEGLTIAVDRLEAQFQFLSEAGYQSYHLSELANLAQLPKKKNIVITFDDGYVSQLELALPLLLKYNLKATFFIPLKYVGDRDRWNQETEPIMDPATLKGLPPTTVELAYHSFAHQMYHQISLEVIEEDTRQAFSVASENALRLAPFLAYPYGKYPRKEPEKAQFFQQLKKNQFVYGLRIGNRVNSFPFQNPYEVQRIDVKGQWSLKKFRRKIKFGKFS
jgi:peptidoglycan/xylan/chitin deacetylase (PgdA/CDA1 family)